MTQELNVLVDIFWNHVRLGQWEFSSATAFLIKDLSQEHYENLLLAVTLDPEKHSSGSKSICSPDLLSWLALRDINTDLQTTRLPKTLRKELEFNFLMEFLKLNAPISIIEELQDFHGKLLQKEKKSIAAGDTSENVQFSTTCCDYLGQLLLDQPFLAVNVIQMILESSDESSLNNLSLIQLICSQACFLMEDTLQSNESEFEGCLLKCFSLLNTVKQHLNWDDKSFLHFFKEVVKKTLIVAPELMTHIWNGIIDVGTNSNSLKSTEELEVSDKLNKVMESGTDEDVDISYAVICSRLLTSERLEDHLNLFLFCFNKNIHALSSVIQGCLLLVERKEYTKVSTILSHPLLKSLSPLVLLVSWVKCTSFNEAELLLKSLIPNEEELCGMLAPCCKKLIYQTKLIQWCIQKTQDILGSEFDTRLLLNVLFKQLDHSSVLYILNETKLLKTLQHQEVVELLQKQTEIHNTYERSALQNTNAFLCFTTMQRMIALLIASKTGKILTDKNTVVDLTPELLHELMVDFRQEIERIETFSLKVEILENLFSLLFLRTTDFKDCVREDVDYDNIDDSSRDSSMSQSLESNAEEKSEDMSNEMKRARRSLIFGYGESTEEKKLLSKDDINEALLQELEGSSSDTLKQRDHYDSHELIHDSYPTFLASIPFLRKCLNLLSECLLAISAARFSTQEFAIKVDSSLDMRISSLQAYTREGQWRLELVTGFELTTSKKDLKVLSTDHVINRMLGSSENLVYLTLKKGDLTQAKQVVKLFNLKNMCSLELDFIDQYRCTSDKLGNIRKIQQKKDNSYSSMDFIKSAASAGKLSSEVNELTEGLLQHEFLAATDMDISVVSVAISVDLMYSQATTLHVAKSLCDLACLKLNANSLVPYEVTIMEVTKNLKSVLNLFLGNEVELIKLTGEVNSPEDFLTLNLSHHSKLSYESLQFQEIKLSQGKSLFKILSGTISVLQSTVQDLREPSEKDKPETNLKDTVKNFLSVFDAETLSELNRTSRTYDYFKSLFKYVNNLSGLTLYYKSKARSVDAEMSETVRPMKVANPFIVFNESISLIFGRLLFEWNLNPKKLELLARQSGVNLIKVITQNCDATESVSDEESRLILKLLAKKTLVLNEGTGHFPKEKSVELKGKDSSIIEELLSSVHDMISETGDSTPLTTSEVCQILNVSTKQLRHLEMCSSTSVELQVVLVNLFNLLFVHAVMLIAADKFDDSLNITIPELKLLLESCLGRMLFFKLIGYQIGDVGVITAIDLYSLLFGDAHTKMFGLREKKTLGRLERFPQLSTDETDPRVLFLLSFSTLDCPPIQVLNKDNFDSMLHSSSSEYLDVHIGIDEEKKEVFIPEMVFLHENIFNKELTSLEDKFHVGLLQSLSEYASEDLKTKLQQAITEKFAVSIEDHNWSLRYQLPQRHSIVMNEISASEDMESEFSVLPVELSSYLKESYPLAGTYIELCLDKNNIRRKTSTVFENNLLYSTSDKKDVLLDIMSSLQSGLKNFTKICSDYVVLKNFVIESFSYFINIFQRVSSFEHSLPTACRKSLYDSLENMFRHKFLLTLSPDKWYYMVPALIECGLKGRSCHKIDLELLVSLHPEVFDIVIIESISELRVLLEESLKKRPENLVVELKRLLLLVRDNKKKTEFVLSVVHLFPAKDVFDLLFVCLESKSDLSLQTLSVVKKTLQETKWCYKVYHMCMRSSRNDAFKCWQDVKKHVQTNPKHVAWFLNDTEAFELMDEWFELYELPEDIKETCLRLKVEHMLTTSTASNLTVQNILAMSTTRQMALRICQDVIANQKTSSTPTNLYIINYIVNFLFDLLQYEEKKKYVSANLGMSCLLLIPEELRTSYNHLVNNPLLIVEQLLMNLKVGILSEVLSYIRSELEKSYATCLAVLASQCDDLLGKYASSSLKMSTVQVSQSNQDVPPLLSMEQTDVDGRDRKTSLSRGEFVPPVQCVQKHEWVKDEMVTSCMQCHDEFSMFNRRHHCRHCGRVVCATCSDYFCHMIAYERKERACKPCYYFLESTLSNSSSPHRSGSARTLRTNSRTFDVPSPVSMAIAKELEWKLTVDSSTNKQLRDEFYFDQAPSAALCLSIVDLYSNSKAASGLLLKFCNDLSQCLQGEKQEVDVGIVAGMIEFILNHAKVKFMKSGDFGGVELCDTYLSRVEIIKILLESNWHGIPTMQEFSQPESLRRLRDKLMGKERFHLALEVTSKCGLDSTPVHFLIGISRLKCGDLEKAREHLSRCLTVTRGDVGTSYGPNHHYLQRIIDVIENTPLLALYNNKDPSSSLSLILHEQIKTKNNTTSSTSRSCLDMKRHNEILYYLDAYGSHGHMIQFLFRNRLMSEAVSYIKEKKCSHEVFITNLLQPCYQDGSYEELFEKVKITDPALKFWEPYFKEACRYFSKKANYHCLYEIQLFIKDFFNAALSCVRFYLGTMAQPAISYSELHKRIFYLQKAVKHFDFLIKERSIRSTFVSHVGSSFLGEDKTHVSNQDIPTGKLKHHLNTVNLQMDVTNFIHNSRPMDQESKRKLPTLFGNGKERAELVVLILMFSIDEALPLASRIIQEFKLPSCAVFSRAVMKLVNERKYQHITNVLQNIEKNGMISTSDKDEILLKVISSISQTGTRDAAQFIKQVRGDVAKMSSKRRTIYNKSWESDFGWIQPYQGDVYSAKCKLCQKVFSVGGSGIGQINAFIACGRLRDAYLEAVKKERVTEIQHILDEARTMTGQRSMVEICEKWLNNHHDNQLRKENALTRSNINAKNT